MDAAALRPLAVGEILDLAIKIYRARFKVLAKAVALVVGPVFLLGALIQISALPDISSNPFDPSGFSSPGDGGFGDETPSTTPFDSPFSNNDVDGGDLAAFLAATLLTTLLSYLATQLATAASFKIVAGAYLEEEPDWKGSLRFARSKLRSLIWLSIVLGFMLFLGFIACIIPGLYFYIAWTVAVPVLLFEDIRGRKALKRSRQLVKGRGWPIAATVLVSTILSFIVTGIITGVVTGVATIGDNNAVNVLVQSVGQITASVLTTPFAAAVIAVIYFDLRVRKEGFDLELLARNFGVEPPAGTTFPDTPSWSPENRPPTGGGGNQPPYWPPPPGWTPSEDPDPPPAPPSGGQPGTGPPFWPPPPDWRPPDG
jgi:hypothetical protein